MADTNKVVVVGSGPSGAVATWQLVRAGVDVVLLEAGAARAARGLTARLAGATVLRLHRPLSPRSDGLRITGDPRSLCYEDISPGGLSNHWSCAVPRFSPDDFEDAKRAGEAFEWPLEYEELSPWYDRVEPLLQIAGAPIGIPQLPGAKVRDPLCLGDTWKRVAEIAQLEGQGLLPIPSAYGARTTVTTSGTVFNSFIRLVRPAQASPHLSIRYEARATRLEWSASAKRVTGVVIRDERTGVDERVPCRAVVLAAGAINTAKLLLQSTNADFPDGLGNSHGVLGRYLHDHPLGKVQINLASPLSFRPPAYLTRAPLDRSAPLYAAACLQWGGVRMLARSLLSGRPGCLASCGFNVFGTMRPSADNFVTLDQGRMLPDGTPGLVLHIWHQPEAEQTLLAARDQLVSLLNRAGLRPEIDNWLVEPVGGSVHYAGTCRMHRSPQYGMLDRWNRLHAIPNVMVADSAAFTTGPEKNPVLTAMALAARATQKLADDLRSGQV